MHPKVSRAEIEVFKALSVAGLTSGMVTQQPIILKSTIPDFCWIEKRKIEEGDVPDFKYLTGYTFQVKQKIEQGKEKRDETLHQKTKTR